MSIVDSHFHIWDPASGGHGWLDAVPFRVLRRRYSIDDYADAAIANGITGGVLVQVLNQLSETYDFLALAAEHPAVLGVVGWVDLEAPDVGETIAALRGAPGGELLVGIRHLVEAEADPGYLVRESVLRGLRAVADAGLVFDLLVSEAQLATALRGIGQVENLQVVLDHAGKPRIAGGPGEPWTSLLVDFAATDRVTCKLSGLVSEAGSGWSAADLRPFVDRIVTGFGPERIMFGSDWPVLNAVASYDQVLDLAASSIAWLSPAEREAILSGVAARVYGLTTVS